MSIDPEVEVRLATKFWTCAEPPPSEFYVVDIVGEPSQEGMPVGEINFVSLNVYWPLGNNERRWVVEVSVVNAGVKAYSSLQVLLDVEFGKPWRYFSDNVDICRWDEISYSGHTALHLEWLAPGEENARTFFVCNRSPLGVRCRTNGSEEEWHFMRPLITDPSQVEKRHRPAKSRDEW